MKKVVFFIIIIFIGFSIHAQETEIIKAKKASNIQIELDIDTERFSKRNNNYFDNEGKGIIYVGYRKISYDAMKNHFGKNDGGLIKIVEEKEIVLNGISFLYAKQEQNRAGIMIEMISYAKKYNETSILEIGSSYPKGENKKYKTIVEKGAISLKLIK